MGVLYVSFGSTVRPKTFGCVTMRSAVLFIFKPRFILYSVGSGVNRVQVVLSGFSVRLFCFVQAKTLCMFGCIYLLSALVLVCVDVMVLLVVVCLQCMYMLNSVGERTSPCGTPVLNGRCEDV